MGACYAFNFCVAKIHKSAHNSATTAARKKIVQIWNLQVFWNF
jgi:hypothetical protein